MDYKDLTALTLKIAGAIMLFWYLSLLPAMISGALKTPNFWITFFYSFLPSLVNLSYSALLFFIPVTVTNKLIHGENLNHDKKLFISLEILVIRLIGIFYLFNGIVDLAQHIFTVLYTPRFYLVMNEISPNTAWTPKLVGATTATVLEIVIALWLVIGADGISNLIRRIRGRTEF